VVQGFIKNNRWVFSSFSGAGWDFSESLRIRWNGEIVKAIMYLGYVPGIVHSERI